MNKKKISIITIIDNYNIGSFLQAFASYKIFNDRDFDVEIVDYQRQHMSLISVFKKGTNKNPIKKFLSSFYNTYVHFVSRRNLVGFLKKFACVSSKRYKSFSSLQMHPPKADIYVTGSDQVWNSNYNKGIDKAFFLEFSPKEKPRYSLAASIGLDKFDPRDEREITTLLRKYTRISVRERSAVGILNDMGFNEVTNILDPTLILTREDWSKLANSSNFVKTEPYLLVYSVESAQKTIVEQCAITIAKQRGLKIYVVTSGSFRNNFASSDRFFPFAGPELFLNLFLHAEYIVASSFHGTAFAINLNKEFITVSPARYNTRVNSLLSIFSLEERLIVEVSDLQNFEKIDFNRVNRLLEDERSRSLKFVNIIS